MREVRLLDFESPKATFQRAPNQVESSWRAGSWDVSNMCGDHANRSAACAMKEIESGAKSGGVKLKARQPERILSTQQRRTEHSIAGNRSIICAIRRRPKLPNSLPSLGFYSRGARKYILRRTASRKSPLRSFHFSRALKEITCK